MTAEFQILKVAIHDGPSAFELSRDGVFVCWADTVEEAHSTARHFAKEGDGLTEVFGRNRQFVLSKRRAWKRFKGEA